MTTTPCPPHHFRLDSPRDGNPTVAGRCSRCGDERQFPVATPRFAAWDRTYHEGDQRDVAAVAEAGKPRRLPDRARRGADAGSGGRCLGGMEDGRDASG